MRTGRALLLHGYTWLIILWLATPISVMIAFSFNDTAGRYNQTWHGSPTLRWYREMFAIPELTGALVNSLMIATASAVLSACLGTGIGLALGRHRFRGAAGTNLLLFAAVAAPEIIMGSSLLTLFLTVQIPLGLVTILIAHVTFSLSFVAIVVRARVLTLDPAVEEAARDLGANAWTIFWRITLPMIFPAVLSGALLAFALSIDDFVTTSFTSGQVTTLPLWIWGVTRVGIPPQVNVMGSLIFGCGVLLAIGNAIVARRRRG